MDNVVARWRHAKRHVWIPSFRVYCGILDLFYRLVHRRNGRPGFVCFSEFERYLQWHHHAVAMEEESNMTVLHVHYEAYGDNGETLATVLEFLGGQSSPRPGGFVGNKTYSHLYTEDERQVIRRFFQTNAQPKIWGHLQGYFDSE